MASEPLPIGTLSSTPQAGQIIRHEGKEYETVKEGLAYILTPRSSTSSSENTGKKKPTETKDKPTVFYNPIQQFNRDLSVLAIRAYGEHAIEMKREKHERSMKRVAQVRGKGQKRKWEAVDEDTAAAHTQTANKKQCINGNAGVSTEGVSKAAPEVAGPKTADKPENNKKPWTPTFTILDALSATGLRALRYAKEIPFATQVIGNDLSAAAIESIKINIQHNGVQDVVRPNTGDACAYMSSMLGPQKQNHDGSYFGKFDVVDLDPYGTAAPFMDPAVQAVADGGMLCVTCTDAGVFASTGYPEKAFALYGGIPIKGLHSHEGGLRLILHALATTAAKHGLAIEPLLCLSIDFYARLFVRVHKSPSEAKFTAGKSMIVYNCDSGCGAWTTQRLAQTRKRQGKSGNTFYLHRLSQAPTATPNCEHCGLRTHLAGPMWAGPLHNPHFIQRILNLLGGADQETYPTFDRIEGMLITALEEDLNIGESSKDPTPESESIGKNNDNNGTPSLLIPRVDPARLEPHPFFFIPSAISKVLHTQTMPEYTLRGALRHLGYKSTRSHAKAGSIRTDAPWSVIWEIMREWVRQKSPVKEGAISEGSAGAGIMRRGREKIDIDCNSAGLRSLKRDILSAVESGKDLSDLTTKIEAALYRSGVRRPPEEKASAEKVQGGLQNGKSQAESSTEPGGSSLEMPDPSTLEIVFDEALGRKAIDAHRKRRLIRYQTNPRPNWGPLPRAPVLNPKKD
ncbi:RNA methyltransferase tRNA(m5U54)methyltransferase [Emydomyces testavorans]|uniref:tRNA (guanine(26)-N(2))-dimethyltransferase n=1 Tax=Emydomyces testavorans TaxID=2070801 RepID=A0AAF0IK88_9EURO|nr:RNA methyltransferase tRNA(m5U54)methyltransferase [Emydomyces testavorans]